MKKQFAQLLVRIGANAFGIFLAAQFLPKITYENSLVVLFIASTVLALINAVVKPIVVIFALPAYLITLGLFSIVVNALMIYLVDIVYKPFEIKGLLTALLAGVVIGLINYIVTRVFDLRTKETT